jgi:hypothetical protein
VAATTKTGRVLKRRAVAAGAILGVPAAAIAQQVGYSERQVRRTLADPATQFLIADIMRPHRDKLRLMAKRAVAVVERGMKAQKKDKADHFTQLRAVERFGELLELAGGESAAAKAKEKGGRQLVTWEEFLLIGRGRQENP